MHQQLPFILALFAIIVLIEIFATKLRIAYPVLLVLAGLCIGFIPALPDVKVDPDMIFFIFLPPLLFEASWSISFKEMKKWWRIIGSFAFLVVFFSAFAVAFITNHFIPGFTLALGFLLGGIVSPPDAVSTGAVMKFVRLPRSMAAILEGESLLNDASSLIIFRFSLLAVGTGQFVLRNALGSFSWMIIGGIVIGLIIAWLFMQAHKRLPTDAPSDIVFTLIEPYLLYWVAEQLHCSGVLAVVAGGLFLSNRRLSFLSGSARIKGYSFWEAFIFILNGMVFMLIGLALPSIVNGVQAEGLSIGTAITYGIVVTAILIIVRIISSYIALLATLLFRPSVAPNRDDPKRMWRMPLLLGWTGMRGVVSLAAALAIPVALPSGEPFPHRSLILFITFVVIFLTLLLQGLSLPFLIKRFFTFNFSNEPTEDELKVEVKSRLVAETVRLLKDKRDHGLLKDPIFLKMIEQWEHKIKHPEKLTMSAESKKLYLTILEEQRKFLLQLNDDPKLHEDAIRWQIYQVDLEEERIVSL